MLRGLCYPLHKKKTWYEFLHIKYIFSKVNEQLQKVQKEENNRPLLFVCIREFLSSYSTL